MRLKALKDGHIDIDTYMSLRDDMEKKGNFWFKQLQKKAGHKLNWLKKIQ